jgi:hypothetical protein
MHLAMHHFASLREIHQDPTMHAIGLFSKQLLVFSAEYQPVVEYLLLWS